MYHGRTLMTLLSSGRLAGVGARARRAGRLSIVALVAAATLVAGGSRADAPTPIGSSPQGAPTGQGTLVRLTPAAAAAAADAVRASVAVSLAQGLDLSLWASTALVADTVTLDIDGTGTAYVISSPRAKDMPDIRQHADWVPDVHTLTSVDDLRRFFRRVLAPSRSAANTWLADLNKDGSRDWRDLTVTKDRIFRVRDTDGDGFADESLVAFEGFNGDVAGDIAGGGLFYNGDLFVTAAPDLWRLGDSNGDGIFESKTSMSHGYSTHPAVSGHDLSAVLVGPDGRLYWKVGDIGMNVVDRTNRRWRYPNQGAVLRSEFDGTGFEVFATGLRNTQEMAFDAHGNLVAVDNDGDHPGETERIVYITYGSDTGWRTTWQYGKYTDKANNTYNVWMDEGLFKPQFAGQAAYITPPIAPYHAGPAGFVFNPGTALDERWRDHFFSSSFTGSANTARIRAFQLREDGAGFVFSGDTEILRGVLSPGMRIGPDGAIYLTDWVRGFKSTSEGRVWKLDSTAGATAAIRAEVRAVLAEDLSRRSADSLRVLLRHADMRVRFRAQFELVHRSDFEALEGAARETDNPLARLHAIWGLGQLGRLEPRRSTPLTSLLTDPDAEVRAQVAKTLGDLPVAGAETALIARLKDGAPRVRMFAAEALGRLRHRAAIGGLVEMLADNGNRDTYLRTAGVAALAAIGDRRALASLSGHPSAAVRMAAVVALRRMRNAEVARFLDDGDEAVVVEAARAANDEGGIVDALPALAAMLEWTPFTSEALLRRAISANLRLGTSAAKQRLTNFAAKAGLTSKMRTEALAALDVWAHPSPFDRVDGSYLGPRLNRRSAAPPVVPN